MLKNIRNNWTTKKTQTLELKDPDFGKIVFAKWSDLKQIYNEEVSKPIKRTKLDYQPLYPNNFEKQKVSLVLNVFDEKTVAALKREAINTHRTDVTENCGKLTNANNSHTRNRCHRELRKINECQHRIRNSLNR